MYVIKVSCPLFNANSPFKCVHSVLIKYTHQIIIYKVWQWINILWILRFSSGEVVDIVLDCKVVWAFRQTRTIRRNVVSLYLQGWSPHSIKPRRTTPTTPLAGRRIGVNNDVSHSCVQSMVVVTSCVSDGVILQASGRWSSPANLVAWPTVDKRTFLLALLTNWNGQRGGIGG
jgi:hypothetical protein